MTIDIVEYKAEELTSEQLNSLIGQGRSFKIVKIKDLSTVVREVEHIIEGRGLSCRVYSEYRSSALAGALIPTGITQTIGLFSAIGIGLHNLVTYNPDYEIGKNELTKSISVINKKL